MEHAELNDYGAASSGERKSIKYAPFNKEWVRAGD